MYFSNLYPPPPTPSSRHEHAHLSHRFVRENVTPPPLLTASTTWSSACAIGSEGTVLPCCAKGASWRAAVSSHRLMSVLVLFSNAVLCSKKVKNKNKNIALSCCGREVTLSNQAFSFCSWKNSLDNKRHAGLLWSSLFLAHFCKNPYLKM